MESQDLEIKWLQLELYLAQLKIASNTVMTSKTDESVKSGNRSSEKSLGDQRAPQRITNPQEWPHIFAPGEPKLFNELSMAEFSAGYTVIIQRCTDVSCQAAPISHFHDLMVLASTYMWSAVHVYHYKVLRSIEISLASWGDSFDSLKQSFFLPTTLLTDSTSKTHGRPSPRQPSNSCSGHSISRSEICDAWSWYDDCKTHECLLHHVCIVCKRNHQAKTCPKQRYPIPQPRQDPIPQDWLRASSTLTLVPPPSSSACQPTHANRLSSQPPPGLPLSPCSTTSPCFKGIVDSSVPVLPIRPNLTRHQISLPTKLQHSPVPNAFTLRLPVPSGLQVHQWRARLQDYHDTDLCHFLEYGWPVGYMAATLPTSTFKNHGSALADKECSLGTTCGPFSANPLCTELTISPLQIAHSR